MLSQRVGLEKRGARVLELPLVVELDPLLEACARRLGGRIVRLRVRESATVNVAG